MHNVNLHFVNGGGAFVGRWFVISGLGTVVIVICASSLICSLAQMFISSGGNRKIMGLVLGAFVVCSAVLPLKNAVQSIAVSFDDGVVESTEISTDDEAYSNAVISQTELNLERALTDILLQNGIEINSCEIILAKTDDDSIITASIGIYMDKELKYREAEISSLVSENFGITPNISYNSNTE